MFLFHSLWKTAIFRLFSTGVFLNLWDVSKDGEHRKEVHVREEAKLKDGAARIDILSSLGSDTRRGFAKVGGDDTHLVRAGVER